MFEEADLGGSESVFMIVQIHAMVTKSPEDLVFDYYIFDIGMNVSCRYLDQKAIFTTKI